MKFIATYIINKNDEMNDKLIFIPYNEEFIKDELDNETCLIVDFIVDDNTLINFIESCVNKDFAMTNTNLEDYYEDFAYLIQSVRNDQKSLDNFKKNLEWAINKNLVSHTNNFLVTKNTKDLNHWLLEHKDFKEFIIKHYLENDLSLGKEIEKSESSFIVYYKDTLLINRYESNLKELKKIDQRREVLLKEIAEDKPKIQKMIQMRFGD